jgi:hypothetical protein
VFGVAAFRHRWQANFQVAAGLGGIDRFDHEVNVGLEARPLLAAQNHDCDFSAREILLIAHVLAGGQEHFETGRFRGQQQLAVLESVPTLLRGGADLMSDK